MTQHTLHDLIHASGVSEPLRQGVQALCKDYEKLMAENERMKAWLHYASNCPCCDQDDECLDGCTFAEDDPNGFDLLQENRKALWGEAQPEKLPLK